MGTLLWKDRETSTWIELDLETQEFRAKPASIHGNNDGAAWTNLGRQLDPFDIEAAMARKIADLCKLEGIRLRPLLERCLADLERRNPILFEDIGPFNALLADLRRELGIAE